MSTLAEIESAASQLPHRDQEELLRQLAKSLRGRPAQSSGARDQWMEQLDTLRGAIGTGRMTLRIEQIFADLREERN